MKTPTELIGVVEKGKVALPPGVHLADGVKVRVVVQEARTAEAQPYDREPLDEAEIRADIEWATGKRFAG